ncbi:MAG: flavin-dependent monooxygenase, partial [Deltaproteobacteria bacterium]|nr:flavin-dependent monooxygenase [Deltaproteobacteria bacterium]
AVSAAVEVVDALFTACGGRVLFQGNDINRHWQDVHAIRAHHANGPDKPAANFGAMQFGNKNTDFFI